MSPLRQRIAERLVEAKQTTAMLTTFNETDMTNVFAWREKHKHAFKQKYNIGLGFMSFFVKASVNALRAIPQLNARIEGDEIVENHYYDIGVAISSDRGLVVPVIRNCERKGIMELAAELGGSYYALDVTSEENTQAVFRAIESEHGRLDIVCLVAGVALEDTTLEELDMGKARKMIDINLFGVALGLKYATQHMHDGGSIVTVGSAAGGGMTVAMQAIYSATKAGVHYLTRTVALEQGHRGIRANTLCPASIAGTGMMVDEDGSAEARFFGGITALGRMGRPVDVVEATLFLASDRAGFITGA